jgi:L-cysteine:1D-myo-inositol 2-amino-2-deoxy-alpha-D-glucopyranoside ligase
MSKSLGNLVFVSALRESGIDPMAIRLAIMANHYRPGWDWTSQGLDAAVGRLERWRSALAVARAGGGGAPDAGGPPDGLAVLTAMRERLADDLDAPGAIAAVDAWADAVLARPADDASARSAELVADSVDALLGVRL